MAEFLGLIQANEGVDTGATSEAIRRFGAGYSHREPYLSQLMHVGFSSSHCLLLALHTR